MLEKSGVLERVASDSAAQRTDLCICVKLMIYKFAWGAKMARIKYTTSWQPLYKLGLMAFGISALVAVFGIVEKLPLSWMPQ
jgi:hypothetical protein